MRKATAISAGLHAAVLLWATLSFSGKTFDVTPAESLPVDLVSEKDFSEMTRGVKDAPKVETPKPLVEEKAEEKTKPDEESKGKDHKKKAGARGKENPPATRAAAAEVRSDRGQDQAAGRAKTDYARTTAATEAASPEAAAEIRCRQNCGF